MRYSEQIGELAAALCGVQAEIKNPLRSKVNAGVAGAPKYPPLENILEDVRPLLAKHGMAVFQSIRNEGDRVGVATALMHKSGQFIESDYAECDVKIPTNRNGQEILTPGQAVGVCITYLRRYSLNAALGINGDADTDGSYTQERHEERREAPKAEAPKAEAPKTLPKTTKEALALVVPFGKHAGKTVKQIYADDRDYITYLAGNAKTDPSVKQAINLIEDARAKRDAAKAQEAPEPKPEPAPAPVQEDKPAEDEYDRLPF